MKLNTSDKNINKNIVLGMVYKPISMLLSYIYVPIVLNYLGTEKYGIWATILSVLSWINLFDIGIGNGLRNKLSDLLARKKQDEETIKKYVSSAYIMLAGIILILLLVVLFVYQFIDWNVVFGLKEFHEEDLSTTMLISTLFMCVSFVMAICKSIYRAIQQNHYVNLMGVFQQTLMLLSIVLLSRLSSGSLLWVAILYGVCNLVVEILFTLNLFRINKSFIPRIKYFSSKEALKTTNLGFMFFVCQIASMILFATDNLIITHVAGPSEVTSYSTANKMFSMVTSVFSIIVAPYWSATTAMRVNNDWFNINRGIKKMLTLWAGASVCCVCVCFVFKPVVSWWLGEDLMFQNGLILLMAVYAIVFMWNSVFSYIGNGLELMKMSITLAVIQGVVNVPLSIWLAVSCKLNTIGVLLGTILSMLISAFVMPIAIYRFEKRCK